MASPPLPAAPASAPRPWSRLHRRGRRRAIGVLLVLVPWTWLLVRDAWAPLNAASVGMPAVAAAGGLGLLIAAAVTRRLLPVLAAASLVAMTALTVIQPMLPQPAGAIAHPFTIASANIYESNPTPKAAAGRSHPYEVSTTGIVVRSAFPITPLPLSPGLPSNRVLLAAVRPPGVPPFSLFAIHAINPIQESSFSFQQAFIQRLEKSARGQQASAGPVVIAGDLNLSDRTHGYRILSSSFRDAMRAGTWAGDTYAQGIWRFALLRIDHLFLSRTWCAADPARFSIPGSDHEGIHAAIGPCT